MKKIPLLICLALLITIIAIPSNNLKAASYALVEKQFFADSLSVLVPSNLVKAPDSIIAERFPDPANYPKLVFYDDKTDAMLSLNITENTGDRESIIHFYRDMKIEFKDRYPSIQFLETDVIRNRTLAFVEFILPNSDGDKIYNMMAFRYVGKNFAMVNFSCPESQMGYWQNTAQEIAKNVKVIR